MGTYLILNVFMLTIVVLALKKARFRRAQMLTLGIILAITIIGDSIIIGLGIVDYSVQKNIGISIGVAPIEDFFYPIAAAILIPSLWELIGKKDA
jgi:lycopene cyclase domain-containing protein